MKKVEAYIKSQRLDDVIGRLRDVEGLTGVSSQEIKGFGRGRGREDSVHITGDTINWIPHVKLEIFCVTELVDAVVAAIAEGAHTGLRGDGKIYVSAVEGAVRISTGEKGKAAC